MRAFSVREQASTRPNLVQRRCQCGRSPANDCTSCQGLAISDSETLGEREGSNENSPASSILGHEISRLNIEFGATAPSDRRQRESQIAARGVQGQGTSLPYLERVQLSFGRHDVRGVEAYQGNSAAQAAADIGAYAFAIGNKVAFGQQPDLHTVAHEAAHIVQQRGNVRLAEGANLHEENADTVASLVLENKSAESELDRYHPTFGSAQYSRAQRLQKQEGPPPENALDACSAGNVGDPEAELDCYVDSVQFVYLVLFDKQMAALDVLVGTAGKVDSPPVWKGLLVDAGMVALAAATGGIGELVAVAVASRLQRVLAKSAGDLIKIYTGIAKAGAQAAIQAAGRSLGATISKLSNQYPEDDPEKTAKVFFEAQHDVLLDAKKAALLSVIAKRGSLKRSGPEGIKAARGMYEAVEANYTKAADLQRRESILSWSVYLAKSVRGSSQLGGTNVAKNIGPFKDDLGVLRLEGNWFNGKQLILTSASMDGINNALKKDIGAMPIGSLRLPIRCRLDVGRELSWAEEVFGEQRQQFIQIYMNEVGVFGADLLLESTKIWLAEKAGHNVQEFTGPQGNWRSATRDQALDGVEAVFKSMKNMKPPL